MKRIMDNVMQPQGFNFGFNLGAAAGAGVRDHVHGHLVPRWIGDTNFMPVIGNVRVVPQALAETAKLFRDAWQKFV
jgi:ATP adenylyltransferase